MATRATDRTQAPDIRRPTDCLTCCPLAGGDESKQPKTTSTVKTRFIGVPIQKESDDSKPIGNKKKEKTNDSLNNVHGTAFPNFARRTLFQQTIRSVKLRLEFSGRAGGGHEESCFLIGDRRRRPGRKNVVSIRRWAFDGTQGRFYFFFLVFYFFTNGLFAMFRGDSICFFAAQRPRAIQSFCDSPTIGWGKNVRQGRCSSLAGPTPIRFIFVSVDEEYKWTECGMVRGTKRTGGGERLVEWK